MRPTSFALVAVITFVTAVLIIATTSVSAFFTFPNQKDEGNQQQFSLFRRPRVPPSSSFSSSSSSSSSQQGGRGIRALQAIIEAFTTFNASAFETLYATTMTGFEPVISCGHRLSKAESVAWIGPFIDSALVGIQSIELAVECGDEVIALIADDWILNASTQVASIDSLRDIVYVKAAPRSPTNPDDHHHVVVEKFDEFYSQDIPSPQGNTSFTLELMDKMWNAMKSCDVPKFMSFADPLDFELVLKPTPPGMPTPCDFRCAQALFEQQCKMIGEGWIDMRFERSSVGCNRYANVRTEFIKLKEYSGIHRAGVMIDLNAKYKMTKWYQLESDVGKK